MTGRAFVQQIRTAWVWCSWLWPLNSGLSRLEWRVARIRGLTSWRYRRLTWSWTPRRRGYVLDSEKFDDPITMWSMPSEDLSQLRMDAADKFAKERLG